MKVVPFIADSAADAVAQIRAKLGPHAVVVNVRKVEGSGLTRLFQSPKIEVLAYVPEAQLDQTDELAGLKQELATLKQQVAPSTNSGPVAPSGGSRLASLYAAGAAGAASAAMPRNPREGWQTGTILESVGILPIYAQRVVEWLRSRHGEAAPGALAEELRLAREAMIDLWPKPAAKPSKADLQVHLFLGPPGVGKTTCLCKLLTQKVLFDGQRAQVWRLDGPVANLAESLSVYGEILGVPVERTRPAELRWEGGENLFIDLPGVVANDAAALGDLQRRLKDLPAAETHLVLNAAYEVGTLMNQIRAYANLGIDDLVLTHLDEEPKWGKLWNLALGTNFSVRWLSSGQNIPGEFGPADPTMLVSCIFR